MKKSNTKRLKLWNKLPWKAMEPSNLGEFDESVLFGLEEVDGNAYKLTKINNGYSLKIAATEGSDEADNDNECELGFVTDNDSHDELAINDKAVHETSEDVDDGKQAKVSKKQKLKKLRKSKSDDAANIKTAVVEELTVPVGNSVWGNVELHSLLFDSLIHLGFLSPTPIQAKAVPISVTGSFDIVGAAETGSGKTLAYVLPIIDYILQNAALNSGSSAVPRRNEAVAIIIAPTRELALQITKVSKDLCNHFKSIHAVSIVSIVGGMSEQKQRRLLGPHSRPPDIIVGTPGRLCEMIQDREIVTFQDMSRLRFLVVDEADRIVEEGHFPELHRLFSRIRDHEKLAERGLDPRAVEHAQQEGSYDDDFIPHSSSSSSLLAGHKKKKSRPDDKTDEVVEEEEEEEVEEFPLEEDEYHFDAMPSESDIEQARRTQVYDRSDEEDTGNGDNNDDQHHSNQSDLQPYQLHQRQTFLYSATALGVTAQQADDSRYNNKKDKKRKKNVKHLNEALQSLPLHLQELLSVVAVQGEARIVDVTGMAAALELHKQQQQQESLADEATAVAGVSSKGVKSTKAAAVGAVDAASVSMLTLPHRLTQLEIRSPSEDKDALTYLFLLKHPGRTLVFVNSIKTARRLDGLLRALELNCRTIHAQLQQRQRLRALEAYQAASDGVLVATDVAARGLDINKIHYVIHYDIARSPQVYVHRSGRTARASESGTVVSVVSPEDTAHHSAICQAQGVRALAAYKGDLSLLPTLTERVQLAKKIFTQSFVASQQSKSKSWIESTAEEMDLSMDDNLLEEMGDEATQSLQQSQSKKSVEQARKQLKLLLKVPLEKNNLKSAAHQRDMHFSNPNKPNKKVHSMRGVLDSHKRKGFVVFAK